MVPKSAAAQNMNTYSVIEDSSFLSMNVVRLNYQINPMIYMVYLLQFYLVYKADTNILNF